MELELEEGLNTQKDPTELYDKQPYERRKKYTMLYRRGNLINQQIHEKMLNLTNGKGNGNLKEAVFTYNIEHFTMNMSL